LSDRPLKPFGTRPRGEHGGSFDSSARRTSTFCIGSVLRVHGVRQPSAAFLPPPPPHPTPVRRPTTKQSGRGLPHSRF
jgi:hypothetical protein